MTENNNPGNIILAGEDKTDQELAALSLLNQDYFLLIVKRYKLKLFNYIKRLTNIADEDIEDILQEVFIKVYFNLNDFDQDLKFSSWIYRIAHNQVISNFRKRKARAEGYSTGLDDVAAQHIVTDLNIIKDIDKEFLRNNIYKILDNLDAKYREVLILKYFDEKNYNEISDITKKPMGTVASLLNKAKDEFRQEMERQEIRL